MRGKKKNNNKMIAVTLCLKRAYQNDETETLPRMDSALGVLLDVILMAVALKNDVYVAV